jgi:hypothetical protein
MYHRSVHAFLDTFLIIQEFSWVIRFILGLSNSVLALDETLLVLVTERNGRRNESRAEDQTGANCFELTRH